MSELGGTVGLGELSKRLALPLPTTHRLVRTLVDLGYVHQRPSRAYSLGLRLAGLGEQAVQLFAGWAMPFLRELVDELGESANMAVLEGDHIVYAAQVPGRHAMRMFTEVGHAAPAHCTAAGKAILAQLPPEQAVALVSPSRMQPRTAHTITTAEGMRTRARIGPHSRLRRRQRGAGNRGALRRGRRIGSHIARSSFHLRSLTANDRRVDPPVRSTAAPRRDDGQPARWLRRPHIGHERRSPGSGRPGKGEVAESGGVVERPEAHPTGVETRVRGRHQRNP